MALFDSAAQSSLPLLADVALDPDTGLPLEENGKLCLLTGQQALGQWVHFALDPASRRFAYPAYTAAYGNEFDALAGTPRAEAESRLPELLRQVLGVNPYITAITDLTLRAKGNGLTAAFTLETVYGPMEYEGEVILYEYI